MGNNRKSLSAKRSAAEGRKVKEENTQRTRVRVDRTQRERKLDKPTVKKIRVGKPSRPLMGSLTTSGKKRHGEHPAMPETYLDLIDPAGIGSAYHIPGFYTAYGDEKLTLLYRFFFRRIEQFYPTHHDIKRMLQIFIFHFKLNDVGSLFEFRQKLKSIRSSVESMRWCVDRFGPAFIPNGIVETGEFTGRTRKGKNWVVKEQVVVHIHRIPMLGEDGTIFTGQLLKSQSAFLSRSPINWLDNEKFSLTGGGPKRNKVNNKDKKSDCNESRSDTSSSTNSKSTSNSRKTSNSREGSTKEKWEELFDKYSWADLCALLGVHKNASFEEAKKYFKKTPWTKKKQQAFFMMMYKNDPKKFKANTKKYNRMFSEQEPHGFEKNKSCPDDKDAPFDEFESGCETDPFKPDLPESINYVNKVDGKLTLEAITEMHSEQINNLTIVDLNGAPYCGFICIAVAAGLGAKKDELLQNFNERYKNWYNQKRKDNANFNPEDYTQYDFGRFENLSRYAHELGYNLGIIVDPVEHEAYFEAMSESSVPITLEIGGKLKWLAEFDVCPSYKEWIYLYNSNDHYCLVRAMNQVRMAEVPQFLTTENNFLFYEIERSCEQISKEIDVTGADLRPTHMGRDKIEIQDTTVTVVVATALKLKLANCFIVSFLPLYFIISLLIGIRRDYLNSSQYITQHFINNISTIWDYALYYFSSIMGWALTWVVKVDNNRAFYLVYQTVLNIINISELLVPDGPDPYSMFLNYSPRFDLASSFTDNLMRTSTIVALLFILLVTLRYFFGEFIVIIGKWKTEPFKVSAELAKAVIDNFLSSTSRIIDWTIFQRTKYINYNSRIAGIIPNTMRYVSMWVESCPKLDIPGVFRNAGHVVYNTLNSNAYISPSKMKNALFSQFSGVKGAGLTNYVESVRIGRDPLTQGQIVAVAPIGSPRTDRGFTGPGYLPATDLIGILAAFAGRSMSRPPLDYNNPELIEFIAEGKVWLNQFIERTDLDGLIEVEPTEFFRQHYSGKKPLGYIEATINQYNHHLAHQATLAECSAFVKLENCMDLDESGNPVTRPRLIMVQSIPMLMEVCQILALIDRWNLGPFGQFQIKDMTHEEMVRKIIDMTDREHCVTDYSSFEASVTLQMRQLENHVIMSLCDRARFTNTRIAFDKYVNCPRQLKSQGIVMNIHTRCSGDPHTSTGNGIMNVVLGAYCYKKKYGHWPHFSDNFMLAEGDDGIVPAEIPNIETLAKLGFSFSTSITGVSPGDCDFLRKRYKGNKVYINVGRAFSVFWVKSKANLAPNKNKYILRVMACSLWHQSPGHPILWAIVRRIGVETNGVMPFHNWWMHIDMYRWTDFDPDNFPNAVVDESMRPEIAQGALGFPGIPIDVQIEIESRILNRIDMDIGDLLNDYPEIVAYAKSLEGNDSQRVFYSDTVANLLLACGARDKKP